MANLNDLETFDTLAAQLLVTLEQGKAVNLKPNKMTIDAIAVARKTVQTEITRHKKSGRKRFKTVSPAAAKARLRRETGSSVGWQKLVTPQQTT